MVTYVWIGPDQRFRVGTFESLSAELFGSQLIDHFTEQIGGAVEVIAVPQPPAPAPAKPVFGYGDDMALVKQLSANPLASLVLERPVSFGLFGPVIVCGGDPDKPVSVPDAVVTGIRNQAVRMGWVESSNHHAAA